VAGTRAATTEITQTDFIAIIDKVTANAMDCMPIGDGLRYYG